MIRGPFSYSQWLIRSPRRADKEPGNLKNFRNATKIGVSSLFWTFEKLPKSFVFAPFSVVFIGHIGTKNRFFANPGSLSALPVLRFRGVGRFRARVRNRETLHFCGYRVWAVASFVGKTWPRKVCEKFWCRNEKCPILFRDSCLGAFLPHFNSITPI